MDNKDNFRDKLVDEANAAIDEMVRQVPGVDEYAPTIARRGSILCFMLRSMYFLGKTRATVEANETLKSKGKSL